MKPIFIGEERNNAVGSYSENTINLIERGEFVSETLFSKPLKDSLPLAERLRPMCLDQVVGQGHLIGPGKPLTEILNSDRLPSIIFWGPPGCGKTTLARLIARTAEYEFESLSAVLSGVSDVRQVFKKAEDNRLQGKRTLLFLDEIHRFNRAQQDSFLAHLEDGRLTLLGATTENPSFELNAALLSRAQVLTVQRLQEEDLKILLERAEEVLGKPLSLTQEAREHLLRMADGDGRALLTLVERLWDHPVVEGKSLSQKDISELLQRRAPLYDKGQEGHYNLISAFHKSLRGSDVDAALYWCARMLVGGEDPLYIARRLVRFASEDIGLADPQALTQALNAVQTYQMLGSPEGELAVTQAVVYLATAPKSNALYTAFKDSMSFAKKSGSVAPPKHILNAPTKLMKQEGYGKGYVYDHNTPEGFSGQDYFPDKMDRQTFYAPPDRGFEREINKRLAYWNKLRQEREA
ncbi:MAG: replication-associated recombination protein A [bacterium]|nr:replication-associated recombination protein A [bacterium]